MSKTSHLMSIMSSMQALSVLVNNLALLVKTLCHCEVWSATVEQFLVHWQYTGAALTFNSVAIAVSITECVNQMDYGVMKYPFVLLFSTAVSIIILLHE